MKKYIDDFAFWIGMISGVASLFAFVSGETPLSLVLSILVVSILFFIMGLYIHKIEKKKYPSEIDGIHINALDLLDTTYEPNSHLLLSEASIEIVFDKSDFHYIYHYKGKITQNIDQDKQGVFFNIANEKNDTENKNKFYGFDNHDSNCSEPIDLYEVSPNGMSKKLFFPFQTTLRKNDVFDICIHGDVYDCLPTKGTTYYFVKLSFNNNFFNERKIEYKCKLSFLQRPKWVNKNIITKNKKLNKCGRMNILFDHQKQLHSCIDIDSKSSISDIRVYTFHR